MLRDRFPGAAMELICRPIVGRLEGFGMHGNSAIAWMPVRLCLHAGRNVMSQSAASVGGMPRSAPFRNPTHA